MREQVQPTTTTIANEKINVVFEYKQEYKKHKSCSIGVIMT